MSFWGGGGKKFQFRSKKHPRKREEQNYNRVSETLTIHNQVSSAWLACHHLRRLLSSCPCLFTGRQVPSAQVFFSKVTTFGNKHRACSIRCNEQTWRENPGDKTGQTCQTNEHFLEPNVSKKKRRYPPSLALYGLATINHPLPSTASHSPPPEF